MDYPHMILYDADITDFNVVLGELPKYYVVDDLVWTLDVLLNKIMRNHNIMYDEYIYQILRKMKAMRKQILKQ